MKILPSLEKKVFLAAHCICFIHNFNFYTGMTIPENLYYTSEHEWIRVEGDTAYIGITDFAQGELGDIVYVDVATEGESLDKDEVFGSVEAVKTVSDLYMPVSGEIIEFNAALGDEPELLNSSPYEAGWIIKVKISDASQLDELLDAAAYKAAIDA